jgi:hypothetical protein
MDTGAAAAQNAAANNFAIGAGVVEKDLVGAWGGNIFLARSLRVGAVGAGGRALTFS